MPAPLNILIVGAGAVGQAYGFHLVRGGARVTYKVRDKYRDALSHGLTVRCLNSPHRGQHLFSEFDMVTTLDEVRDSEWDQVWLCISSPALRGGWLEAFAECIGEATLVMLQPGLEDYTYVTGIVPSAQVVYGMITLTSFHAPLDGGSDAPSMDWWFPPLSPAPFAGEAGRTRAAVQALKAGGMPAKRVASIEAQLRLGSGILMPVIASLEAADWRFDTLRRGDRLALTGRAALQATRLSLPGQLEWLKPLLTHRWVLRLLLFIAPKATPFDLQAMLRSHFIKVGDQTRAMLRHYITLAAERDEPADAIAELLEHITR
ncbi:MAG: ketopantoate reductase family protein [Myxococcota bacterium]